MGWTYQTKDRESKIEWAKQDPIGTIHKQTFKTKGEIKEKDIADKYEPKESCDNHPSIWQNTIQCK